MNNSLKRENEQLRDQLERIREHNLYNRKEDQLENSKNLKLSKNLDKLKNQLSKSKKDNLKLLENLNKSKLRDLTLSKNLSRIEKKWKHEVEFGKKLSSKLKKYKEERDVIQSKSMKKSQKDTELISNLNKQISDLKKENINQQVQLGVSKKRKYSEKIDQNLIESQ